MFLDSFDLTTHPFTERPPVEWLLRDPRIDQAMARLKFFRQQGVIALITGQTGIGKSTLLKLFIHELPHNRFDPVYVHLTPLKATAFLRLIVTRFGEAPRIGKDRLFLQIINRIKQNEKSTILIIDEAHMIDPEALTDLRLLVSCMDVELPLKIILCGQEPLRNVLKRSVHADLVHRITVRCILSALSKDQTSAYIDNRMHLAGASTKIFTPEAKELIHDYTGGVPRQINNVATACLINAASQNKKSITEDLTNSAMAEFTLP